MADSTYRTGEPQRTRPRPGAMVVLYLAMVTVGLMAGVFFAWDVTVMPGLARVDDRTFVVVMQALILAVLESAGFSLVFLAAVVFTVAATALFFRRGERTVARWLLLALVLYLVAPVLTFAVQTPLNDELVNAGEPDQIADLAGLRADFERPWVVANAFRTVACVLSLLCLGRALSLYGRSANTK